VKLNKNDILVRWGLSALIIIFVLSLIYYGRQIISDIKDRETATIKRFANFLEYVGNNDTNELNYFADDILIENNSIPVIVTDQNFKIISFKNIDISEEDIKSEIKSSEIVEKMRSEYDPIKISIYDENDKVISFQYIFYKNSDILNIIILAPYYLFSFILLIFLSLYLIFYYSNTSEKDRLWTGLAKETAHQLGTPLSSLIGWNEYIKTNKKIDKEILTKEIDKDLNRLNIITDRFSNIGSKPKFKNKDLKKVIEKSIEYLKKRVSKKIKTIIEIKSIEYNYNELLFSWVIENLYKNAVDAIGEKGEIKICLYDIKNKIFLDFIDNGIGIDKNNFKSVFNPGFSTKKRGWGLGLTLTKRIINNYHKGKIFVAKSIKNKETIIRIELNR
tara:strand:+ start:1139 stop:2305 length:1167 start_codon:yes stop_codon:yes gene_type:complete